MEGAPGASRSRPGGLSEAGTAAGTGQGCGAQRLGCSVPHAPIRQGRERGEGLLDHGLPSEGPGVLGRPPTSAAKRLHPPPPSLGQRAPRGAGPRVAGGQTGRGAEPGSGCKGSQRGPAAAERHRAERESRARTLAGTHPPPGGPSGPTLIRESDRRLGL